MMATPLPYDAIRAMLLGGAPVASRMVLFMIPTLWRIAFPSLQLLPGIVPGRRSCMLRRGPSMENIPREYSDLGSGATIIFVAEVNLERFQSSAYLVNSLRTDAWQMVENEWSRSARQITWDLSASDLVQAH